MSGCHSVVARLAKDTWRWSTRKSKVVKSYGMHSRALRFFGHRLKAFQYKGLCQMGLEHTFDLVEDLHMIHRSSTISAVVAKMHDYALIDVRAAGEQRLHHAGKDTLVVCSISRLDDCLCYERVVDFRR